MRQRPSQAGALLVDIGPARSLGIGLVVLSVLLGLLGGRRAASDQVGGYGIVSALPAMYWIAVGLGAVASALLLRTATTERTRYAAVVPMMWLGILHTSPHLAHDHVRFQTVWTNLGFVRFIDESSSGDVLIDTRFAWPGFFGVFMAPLADIDDGVLDLVLRLWPTAVLGATAVLVSAFATRSYPSIPVIGPVSALVYILLAWTGQDHFSPQSFGFIAYLAMLVLLESGPLRSSLAWSASVPTLARFAAAGGDRPAARSTPVFVALVVLGYGAIVSDPLAPFFMCLGLFIVGVYGRTVAWRLLAMLVLGYLGWFLVTAEPWWSTQLDDFVAQIGFFGDVRSTTADRVAASSREQLFVTGVRLLVGVATFSCVVAIGVALATERFRHLRPAVPLVPLATIPSIALVLQSWGRDIVFGVVLFTLPFAAILIGRVIAAIRVRALPVLVPVVVLVLTPLLLVARFGNEAFEMTTGGDRAVLLAGYERAEDDTLFVLDSGFAPARDRTIGRNEFAEIPAAESEAWIRELQNRAEEAGKDRIIVLFTPSQAQWRIHGLSSPVGYLDGVAEWLRARPGTTVLYEGDGGWAIEL